jgi:glycosyltransferase involved in cell wall biosynthesis
MRIWISWSKYFHVSSRATWHILTGEYPPQCGGVGDYTQQLAHALSDQGENVNIWCPQHESAYSRQDALDGKVQVCPVKNIFTAAGRRQLESSLDCFSGPKTLLLQYVPNALGMRGVNLPFCQWLLRRSRNGDDVRVMFHEPYFYFSWRKPWRNVLAVVQRAMACTLIAASSVIYLSTIAWQPYLRLYDLRRETLVIWLPIPSTIPVVRAPGRVAEVRRQLQNTPESLVVGHFGTYGDPTTLQGVLAALLSHSPNIVVQLLGQNGGHLAEAICALRPEWKERVRAFGFLDREDLSLHLQACDLLIQPYRDGATSRRTSLMAGLCHGVPTLTNKGFLSEPLWTLCELPLVPEYESSSFVRLADGLLHNAERRRKTGEVGRQFYNKHFSIETTIHKLLPDVTVRLDKLTNA